MAFEINRDQMLSDMFSLEIRGEDIAAIIWIILFGLLLIATFYRDWRGNT